jgi:hypothetical protein
MNFTDTLEGAERNVELKYCERCGGLFLRDPEAGIVYCESCASRMANPDAAGLISPRSRRRNRGARLASGPGREPKLQGNAHIKCLRGVAAEEARSC